MKTPIIPERQTFYKIPGDTGLNLKAICVFAAIGFFLEKDTYFNNLVALQPATEYKTGENNFIQSSNTYWHWHYSPREISLKQATEEFANLFERISSEKLKDRKVILPLSGGLDSRTQAAMMTDHKNVNSYSYKFEDSFDETKYGKEISRVCSLPFYEYEIPKGYLWGVIEELAKVNQCYSEFTHPRQMAVINEISKLGDIFYLGHMGDVLFDDSGVEDRMSFDKQVKVVIKKLIKKGGLQLAESLWNVWKLEGTFSEYFKDRIFVLLKEIKIDSANARLRAFKSMYRVPRWTNANLRIFSINAQIALPYYDDEMCKFICTIPEHLLSGRQIQINYIKMKNPKLAGIPWQDVDPLNLYNHEKFESKRMLPWKAFRKGKRILNEKLFGKKLTIRNWENQFIGKDNDENLRKRLFENKLLTELVPVDIVRGFYDKFRNEDAVYYSHPVSMLLTLSMFCKMHQNPTLIK